MNEVSPEAALARLLLAGVPVADIGAALPPGSPLAIAFAARRPALETVAHMLAQAGVDHAGARNPAAIARMFDAAVAIAPEASVAAYTLNDADMLARATGEIVGWLLAEGLLQPASHVLDVGCGIGRVAAALTPHVAGVLGIDVSPGMIAEARRRHTHPKLRFEITDGGPPDLPAGSIDLILAVDSFPYLVQAGVAGAHMAAAGRMLRPNGALAILNLSYEGVDADAANARAFASSSGLRLVCCGIQPFKSWDGRAYILRR